MWLIDAFSLYLYALKYLALALAVIILVSGLDDLFIDVVYWLRRVWRALTVYGRHKRFDPQTLHQLDEKPLAIMVPAWQEHGVIGKMAELAATTLDYENYHIFVGTYPNDAQTQREVEQVQARFPNVHKVVCVRPGPTSKADCLNNVLDAIFQFEKRAGGVQLSGGPKRPDSGAGLSVAAQMVRVHSRALSGRVCRDARQGRGGAGGAGRPGAERGRRHLFQPPGHQGAAGRGRRHCL